MKGDSGSVLNIILTLEGGQGRDVVDAAQSSGRSLRLYGLEGASDSPFGKLAALEELVLANDQEFFIGARLNENTQHLLDQVLTGAHLGQVVHQHAYVSQNARLGRNVFVGAMVTINPQATVEDFVFINAGCTIDHDCTIGRGTSLGPGVTFPGYVSIGEACAIGAGVVARPGASVVSGCTVGAGAVIAKDLTEPGVYVGNPARRLD